LSDSGSDSGEFLQNPDFPFDPDCTLILYGVHGRNPKGLFKKFAAVGLLIYFQPVAQYDSIIIAYETHEQACRAKNTIEGEKILFCTEDTTIPSNSLLLPPKMRNFLTSPPPSPPEDWAPHSEDINRVAFVDLVPTNQEDGTVQLLPKSISAPSIVVVPEMHEMED
jgi:hypothetical protein